MVGATARVNSDAGTLAHDRLSNQCAIAVNPTSIDVAPIPSDRVKWPVYTSINPTLLSNETRTSAYDLSYQMAGLLQLIGSAIPLLPATLSLTLPSPLPFHSTTPSSLRGPDPGHFPPCVLAGDWPQAPCRYHIPGTDLSIEFDEYSDRFPLSWGQNVAQGIDDIETRIRRNSRSRIINKLLTSGPVGVRFISETTEGPLLTAPEAVQVLATIWSFTVMFGAREIEPSLIWKAHHEWERAVFWLDIDFNALNRTEGTDIF